MFGIAARGSALEADGQLRLACVVVRRYRHHEQLTEIQVLVFTVVYAGNVLAGARTEESLHRAVLENRKDCKALVRKGELFILELLAVNTVSADHTAFTLLVGIYLVLLVEGQKHHAVVRNVLLDVVENLVVNVLDGHGLEKLVLVAVQNAELVLADKVLCRNKALVVEGIQGTCNVGKGLDRRLVESVGVQRVYYQCANTVFALVQNGDCGKGLDHGIVDIVEQRLAARKVSFQQAFHIDVEKLADKPRCFGHLYIGSYLDAGVCTVDPDSPLLVAVQRRENDQGMNVGNDPFKTVEQIRH